MLRANNSGISFEPIRRLSEVKKVIYLFNYLSIGIINL